MPINWNQVTVTHVQQACDLFDSGKAIPKRSAKNTFLLFNGKTYPGKFIRGLAYQIATGIELDPNRDYSGGDETARFFEGIGLQTSKSGTNAQAGSRPSPSRPLTPIVPSKNHTTERSLEPQKKALLELLKTRFGTVEVEANFSWLVVPCMEEIKEPLRAIHSALQNMRGFSDFAKAGRLLRCDFFIPHEQLIVEYDERQHFTIQRAKALDLYPADLSLAFDRQAWITACNSIRATDPNPPYRDEQRAYYDSLRDILSEQNGHRLVRIRQGDFDWTGSRAEEELTKLISNAANYPTDTMEPSRVADSEIRKVALVAHDYNVQDVRGQYDNTEHFSRINKLCDNQGCDTILYALYTWDSTSPIPRTYDSIFEDLQHVQRVVLEVGTPPSSFDHVEVWVRGQPYPIMAYQRFATSTSSSSEKQRFVDDLVARQIDSASLVICGETNIVKLKRASKTFEDAFNFCQRLDALKSRVILNPIHDYMTRYEMREKRRFYSLKGRTVLSVWNKGRGKESWLPWTVFYDGEEMTDQVRELRTPFAERPDIRIGIATL